MQANNFLKFFCFEFFVFEAAILENKQKVTIFEILPTQFWSTGKSFVCTEFQAITTFSAFLHVSTVLIDLESDMNW